MVDINLLPWRDAACRQQHERVKFLMTAAAALTLCLAAAAHIIMSGKADRLTQDVARLEQERGNTGAVPAQSAAAQSDMQTAARIGKVFAALGRRPAHGVCFTKIAVNSVNDMELEGMTSSSADLAGFLLDWDAAAYFAEIQIERLQHAGQAMQFRLRGMVQHAPNPAGAES